LLVGDWKTVDGLMGEDLIFTDSDGEVTGKKYQMDVFKSGDFKLDSAEMTDVKVQDLGNVAVATGKLVEKARYKGEDASGTYRFTDVWVKRDGKWWNVTGHESRVVEKK
jgi:ketosteroid isomerase-like protein